MVLSSRVERCERSMDRVKGEPDSQEWLVSKSRESGQGMNVLWSIRPLCEIQKKREISAYRSNS